MPATTVVIFGASGDLTARKLVPALYNNFRKGRLPENTHIVGFSRTTFTDDSFRGKMGESIREFAPSDYDEATWTSFARFIHYQPGDMNRHNDFVALERLIHAFAGNEGNRLYYLSTAPQFYPVAISMLGAEGMARESESTGYRRIIIEKPFGHDLDSARKLNAMVHETFRESQVYRIDHYLGKETVQNILVFRFANAIFEPIWNRNYVQHVQITVAETIGVGHRAAFYESAGVLRDMFQNHLLQLLTLVAMEAPVLYEADALRNEKVKVLRAIRPIEGDAIARQTVRGQYRGYRAEKGVALESNVPTFAAMKLYIDNWRWQGVPFYLRSGKLLADKASEVSVQFRRPPQHLFGPHCELFTNMLTLCIQPNEGLHLRFAAKVPDKGMLLQPGSMDFAFRQAIPEAYERLLLDAITGDASLFARSDEIELAWQFVDAICRGWEGPDEPPLHTYEPRSWGPAAADALILRDGGHWTHGCGTVDEGAGPP